MKKLMAAVLVGASWMLGGPTPSAQETAPQESTSHVISNQDLNLLRQDLRSKRKQLPRLKTLLRSGDGTFGSGTRASRRKFE